MTTKPCSKCNIEKELEEFHRSAYTKDGRINQCKECKNKVNRASVAKRRMNMRYENTIGSIDEGYAYEAFLALKCKSDEDYAKPEFSLEAFREQVRTWVVAQRRIRNEITS